MDYCDFVCVQQDKDKCTLKCQGLYKNAGCLAADTGVSKDEYTSPNLEKCYGLCESGTAGVSTECLSVCNQNYRDPCYSDKSDFLNTCLRNCSLDWGYGLCNQRCTQRQVPFCAVGIALEARTLNINSANLDQDSCIKLCNTISRQQGDETYGEGGGDLSLTNIVDTERLYKIAEHCPAACANYSNTKIDDDKIKAYHRSVPNADLFPLQICQAVYSLVKV